MAERPQLVQRIDFLGDISRGKAVLHLGCTNFPYTQGSIDNKMLLHHDLEAVAGDLWGIDSDQEGIDTLLASGSKQIVRGDLENLVDVTIDREFDVIIAGEMIEHLNNPGVFLDGVRRFMSAKTQLVITTVNAYCAMRFFHYGLRGKGGTQEPVHPDHVAYYSYSTLRLLVERHGMRVENFLFYDIGREHRPHNRWILNAVNDLCVAIAPQWADGLIAVCRREDRAF